MSRFTWAMTQAHKRVVDGSADPTPAGPPYTKRHLHDALVMLCQRRCYGWDGWGDTSIMLIDRRGSPVTDHALHFIPATAFAPKRQCDDPACEWLSNWLRYREPDELFHPDYHGGAACILNDIANRTTIQ